MRQVNACWARFGEVRPKAGWAPLRFPPSPGAAVGFRACWAEALRHSRRVLASVAPAELPRVGVQQATDPRRDKDFLGHSVSNRQSALSRLARQGVKGRWASFLLGGFSLT